MRPECLFFAKIHIFGPSSVLQGFTVVLFLMRRTHFKNDIRYSHFKIKRQMRFFKKEKETLKKGKTFHKKEKITKKSLPRTCSCIKFTLFFMFENSMSMCHTDFFFFPSFFPPFFVWLLISFYFLYGDFHAGAVQFR